MCYCVLYFVLLCAAQVRKALYEGMFWIYFNHPNELGEYVFLILFAQNWPRCICLIYVVQICVRPALPPLSTVRANNLKGLLQWAPPLLLFSYARYYEEDEDVPMPYNVARCFDTKKNVNTNHFFTFAMWFSKRVVSISVIGRSWGPFVCHTKVACLFSYIVADILSCLDFIYQIYSIDVFVYLGVEQENLELRTCSRSKLLCAAVFFHGFNPVPCCVDSHEQIHRSVTSV